MITPYKSDIPLLTDLFNGEPIDSVTITTDGSCKPNPGPGAWACVLRSGDSYREMAGRESAPTTNNRMELRAMIEGLRALKRACNVRIRSDSMCAISWCKPGASRRLQKDKTKEAVLPLIAEFHAAAIGHHITFEWIRGHAGDIDNERCDRLAELATRKPF